MKAWDQPVVPRMSGFFVASEVQDACHPVFWDARKTLPGPDQASDDGRISVCVTALEQHVSDGITIGCLFMEIVQGPNESYLGGSYSTIFHTVSIHLKRGIFGNHGLWTCWIRQFPLYYDVKPLGHFFHPRSFSKNLGLVMHRFKCPLRIPFSD